jgi:hypothetical protein
MKRDQVIITSLGNTRSNKLFNTQGQLNAKSLQQALQQLVKFAAMLESFQPK